MSTLRNDLHYYLTELYSSNTLIIINNETEPLLWNKIKKGIIKKQFIKSDPFQLFIYTPESDQKNLFIAIQEVNVPFGFDSPQLYNNGTYRKEDKWILLLLRNHFSKKYFIENCT